MADSQARQNSSASSNLDVVRAWYEAEKRGDLNAFYTLFAPEIEFDLAEGYSPAGAYVGHKNVIEGMMPAFFGFYTSYSSEPEEFFDAGDTIVVLGHYQGHTKETNRELKAAFAHIWSVRDGKIARIRQYTDTATQMLTLGADAARQLGEKTRLFRSPKDSGELSNEESQSVDSALMAGDALAVRKDQAIQALNSHARFLMGEETIDTWVAIWAEDALIEFPYAPAGLPRRVESKSAIREYFKDFPNIVNFTAFPDLKAYSSHDTERIFLEFRCESVVVSTGLPYNQTYSASIELKDGLVTFYREFWNPTFFVEAFGGTKTFNEFFHIKSS